MYKVLPERGNNARLEFVAQSGKGDFRWRQ
jgi:hypothetical protein